MTSAEQVILSLDALQGLLDDLKVRGYRVIGPTIRDQTVIYDEIDTVSDLPRGWTDVQDGGHYRLKRRDDATLFGYAAKELARYKIRVAGIAPGLCDTRMVAKMPAKILDKIISTIPLRRLGEPEEIARTALFILQNDFYDGRVLEIDGGLRL